jgi:hypothetical protein
MISRARGASLPGSKPQNTKACVSSHGLHRLSIDLFNRTDVTHDITFAPQRSR